MLPTLQKYSRLFEWIIFIIISIMVLDTSYLVYFIVKGRKPAVWAQTSHSNLRRLPHTRKITPITFNFTKRKPKFTWLWLKLTLKKIWMTTSLVKANSNTIYVTLLTIFCAILLLGWSVTLIRLLNQVRVLQRFNI